MAKHSRAAAIAAAFTVFATACGGGSEATVAPADCSPIANGQLTIVGEDTLAFDPNCYQSDTGTINIDYLLGPTANQIHDLRIDGRSDLFLEIDAGTRQATGSVSLPPGRYELYCSLGGHREAGMEATLFVEG